MLVEADTEEEKLQWMMLLHYAALDLQKQDRTQDPAKRVLKEDHVQILARRATDRSNIAVNHLYQLYEDEMVKSAPKKREK